VGRRPAGAALAFEGGAAAIAFDIHFEDRRVVDETIEMLARAPDLRAVAIFEEICRRHSEIGAGVRRTIERRVRAWMSFSVDVLGLQTKVPKSGGGRPTPTPVDQDRFHPQRRWRSPRLKNGPQPIVSARLHQKAPMRISYNQAEDCEFFMRSVVGATA
jgi:hypothetical protein